MILVAIVLLPLASVATMARVTTIDRTEYRISVFLGSGALALATALPQVLGLLEWRGPIVALTSVLFLLVWLPRRSAARLTELGRSKWWGAALGVPFVNLAVILFLCTWPSPKGPGQV